MSEQPPLTIPASEFVEAVRRSDVVEEAPLEAALDEFLRSKSTTGKSESDVAASLARFLIRKDLLTRYQAKELLQGRFRRLRMDHFVIRDLIGVGGMGAVFRAYDENRNEEVALKVLSERFKHDAGMRARFHLEARAGMELDHPGIVKTYELGETDDVFGEVDYATMELFEGIALHELVGIMGPVPVNAACDIACQAAEALSYLHSKGMIHRDVKPDNVLVDREGNVKVIDFGLTLVSDSEEGQVTPEGEEFSLAMIFGHDCLGTPDYMPPEQAVESQEADARSDVYALGCTLFVALTAKRPYYAKSGRELINLHKSQPAPDPRTIVESTPPEVARAVLKMLAKNPDERFQTMQEVHDALDRFATQRRIDFSFSGLIRSRMALAIKQGRISLRKTSTVMRLSNAGRQSKHGRILSGGDTGSTAALQATGSPRDTSINRPPRGSGGKAGRGTRVGHESSTTAASGADDVLREMGRSVTDEDAAATGAMLKLPDGGLFRLARAEIVIGRSHEEADFVIDDKRLSARHCRLTYDGTRWQVLDLESTNGTEINGEKISIAPLFGRDRLRLGGEITLTMDWSRRRPGRGLGLWGWFAVVAVLLATVGGVIWWSL